MSEEEVKQFIEDFVMSDQAAEAMKVEDVPEYAISDQQKAMRAILEDYVIEGL